MSWGHVIHLGDLPLTMAAAAAMSVWMIVSRFWRLAIWWSVLFLMAIMLVAATKIAFLVSGAWSQAVNFQALSGHATGATAVFVVLLYLMPSGRPAGDGRLRRAGIAAGLILGALLSTALVIRHEHSIAEAAAGWAVGALAGIGAIRLAGQSPDDRTPQGVVWASIVFIAAVIVLRQLPIGYLMWRVAKVVARHTGALTIAEF